MLPRLLYDRELVMWFWALPFGVLCGAAAEAPAGRNGAEPQAWRLAAAEGSPLNGLPKVNGLGLADFNADGRLDLAAINGDPGELLIMLNQGKGRFAQPQAGGRISIGATASGLAVGDVNGDGAADLVISYHDHDEVGVLLADGAGGFKPRAARTIFRRSHGSPHVHNLALGDVNGDGRLDVVVAQAEDNAIIWALGDGGGGFATAERTLAAGRHPYTIIVADFNGDGHLDFASPNAESHDLTVGLGDGAGQFVAPSGGRPRIARQTLSVAAGDINGDGAIDLVANSDVNQRELMLLLGDGRGGFAAAERPLMAPARCYGQVVGDLDGDGVNDVIAPCIDRNSVLVFVAEDARALGFRRMEFPTPGVDSQVVAIGDLNADGVLDVAAAGWSRPMIAILLGERAAAEP